MAQHDRSRGSDALTSRLWETMQVAVAGDVEDRSRSPLTGLREPSPVQLLLPDQALIYQEDRPGGNLPSFSRNSSKIFTMRGRL